MKYLSSIGKALISLLALFIIYNQVDFKLTMDSFRSLDPIYLVLSVVILIMQALIASLRWNIVLNSLKIAITYLSALKIFSMGLFFNQILPSSIGGDSVRGYLIYKKGNGVRESIKSVLIDRVIGLIILMLIAMIALIASGELIPDSSSTSKILLITLIFPLVLSLVLFLDKFKRFFPNWKYIDEIFSILNVIRRQIFSIKPGGYLIVISIIAHSMTVLVIYLLSLGMGAGLSLDGAFIIVPISTLVMVLPISISGWGIREGTMIVGMGYLGIAAESALAISLLYGILVLLVALPGGFIWMMSGRNRSIISEIKSKNEEMNL